MRDSLWISFWLALFLFSRRPLTNLVDSIRRRITSGAGLKVTVPSGLSVELRASNQDLPAVPPTGVRFDTRSEPRSLPDWARERQAIGRQQRGVHLAHTLAPSDAPGQIYDLYVYLVGWARDRFDLPNDLTDIARAEFYLGPAWRDEIILAESNGGRIGFRTSAYAPALCLCRVTFKDGHTTLVTRYLDFEMGQAVGKLPWIY